jgi:hypothetical protein
MGRKRKARDKCRTCRRAEPAATTGRHFWEEETVAAASAKIASLSDNVQPTPLVSSRSHVLC